MDPPQPLPTTASVADVHALISRPAGAVPAATKVATTDQPRPAQAVAAWAFRNGVVPVQVKLDDLATQAADAETFVWVDVTGRQRQELQTAAKLLDLPEAAVRAVQAGPQRPGANAFGDCVFVAVEAPRQDPSGQTVLPSELDLFIGRSYLVSVHEYPTSVTEHVLTRAAQHPTPVKLEPVLLLSVLMDELLAHYEELTEDLEDDIEAMEERALTDASDAFLADLLALKRYVFTVYRLAGQHRAVVTAFLRPDLPLIGGGEVEPYFRDLDERLGRLLNSLEAAKEAVNGAFDLFVSQVSRRTNDIMKVLAIVSTVLLPSTVILGFFGTSFQTPPIATNATFAVMIAAIVLVTGLILLVFHRWGWLRGSPSMSSPASPRPKRRGED